MGKKKDTWRAFAARHHLKVEHGAWRDGGAWFHPLKAFPAFLGDEGGYVWFETKQEYENAGKAGYIRIGVEINVPKGIRHIPGYIKIMKDFEQKYD
ncbi:hypothetical protein GGQ74_002171 [Desulfobaculum xiamenense]|uniref:Uncharacterized protein n=1 Tax=Desulfobaculum xiamenense TaxID=995050 RepID=A0A846QJW4_9BACT|nr:hypothetical protein [Desulfobaculum xiamenense]NJB68498.1 hypothetical protein [Desulfobaculum xiamenense]